MQYILLSLFIGGISCLFTPVFTEEYSGIKSLSVILFWPFWWIKWIYKLILEILK